MRAIFKQRQEAAEGKLKALETGGAAYLAEEKGKLEKAVADLKASSAAGCQGDRRG